MFQKRNYPPEKVAAGMLRAVARDRAVAPVTPEAWIFYVLKRLSPSLTAALGRAFDRQAGAPAGRPQGTP